MAELDKLTGFMTQKYFFEQLEYEVLRVKRYKGHLSLIMASVNYDFFEKKYEVKRHLSYAVLKQLGIILRRILRNVDILTRYDGDNIAIMLTETDEAGAMLVAERIRKAVETNSFKGDEKLATFNVAITAGVATFVKHAKTARELVVGAEKALHLGLAKGGNCVEPCPIILDESYI